MSAQSSEEQVRCQHARFPLLATLTSSHGCPMYTPTENPGASGQFTGDQGSSSTQHCWEVPLTAQQESGLDFSRTFCSQNVYLKEQQTVGAGGWRSHLSWSKGLVPCLEDSGGEGGGANTILPAPALHVACDSPRPDPGCGICSEDGPAPSSLLPEAWTCKLVAHLLSRLPGGLGHCAHSWLLLRAVLSTTADTEASRCPRVWPCGN